MSYRSVRTMTAIDEAAYVAGLIDGEGTVTLSRRHASDQRQLVVSTAKTDLPLLRYVLDTIGAGKITAKRITRSHHTPSYCFSISNRQALRLLEQVELFLRTYKKQRACLAITDYVRLTPRNGRYTTAQQLARSTFENTFLALGPHDVRE